MYKIPAGLRREDFNMESVKTKKPFFKKIWFWVILIVVIGVIAAAGGGEDTTTNNETTKQNPVEENISYEQVDIQFMLDELEKNALKAEKTYMNKNVEISGKIKTFDSDGTYITVEPVNADTWNFSTIMCNIEDEVQLDFLLEKSVGDVVNVKGTVTSVGEVLGYSVDIDEVY